MAQIGHGYGSEFHLMRFMGRHRKRFEQAILDALKEQGVFNWLDFGFGNPLTTISGDKELTGLNFLKDMYPDKYSSVIEEYHSYKIGKIDSWQSWDAIFTLNKTLYLVEAKAYVDELCDHKKHGGESRREILRFFKEQLPTLPVEEHWLRDYYQFANRLATTALLNKHGIDTKTLYIYFINGFRKRKEDNHGKLVPLENKNASKSNFQEAIILEHKYLGLENKDLSAILAKPVFIDAEPSI